LERIECVVWCNVADTDLPCERIPVTVMPNHRKVIEEIMQAAPDGILLSELPHNFKVTHRNQKL